MAKNEEQEFTDFEVEHNFEETQAWDGEQRMAPPGDYTLTVVAVEQKNGKNSGNPYAAVTFEIQDEGDQKGVKVFNNYTFTQAAMGRVKQLMVACGARLDKFRASEIMGATIRGTVYHTEGEARIGEDGNPLPAKTFANLKNEQPLPQEEAPKAAAPAQNKPPIANKPANNAKPAAGARRA